MKTESDPQLHTKLLQVICQLHEWENQHLDLVQTQAGRYLYLSLVKQLIDEKRDQPSALLKGTGTMALAASSAKKLSKSTAFTPSTVTCKCLP